jgi:hypothetical protein
MTRAQIDSNAFVGFVSVCFFVSLVPVLDFFVHPGSVMYGEYVPLLIRLSALYWQTGFLSVSGVAVPLLLLALTLLTHRRRFGFVRSLSLLVAPFSLALLIQYLIVVQLDAELRSAWSGRSVQWRSIFQFPFMMECLLLILTYALVAALLWFIVRIIWRVAAAALTRRSSERLPAAR